MDTYVHGSILQSMDRLRLIKKIVAFLQKLNYKGIYPTREEFVELMYQKKLFWLNYVIHRKNIKDLIDEALGDIINPMDGKQWFVDYYDPHERTRLKVTKDGRFYLAIGGWLDALLKGRSFIHSTSMTLITGGLGAIIGTAILWILNNYQTLLCKILGC
jgi:hypothetical protein